ncbi:MAG: HAD family hydrolase [Candidatus Woesearchaeota archaeon]
MFSIFKKEIKLICFDLDNTLCDSNSAESETESYMMEFLSKKIISLQSKKNSKPKSICSAFSLLKIFNEIKNYHLHHDLDPNNYSRALWFRELLEKVDETLDLGISVNSMILKVDEYEMFYWNYYSKKLNNYPNTLYVLKTLRSKGLKLALVTDSDGKREIKLMRLKNLGINNYFDYIVTSDDVGFNKPDKRNWEYVLKISGFSAKQSVMIGDHPDVDLVNAKKLGFITIWTKESLNNDSHHNYVDYEIRDIKEVLGIIDKLSK